mgnify:CR=1 FL=1
MPEWLYYNKEDENYVVGAAIIYISMIYSLKYDLECCPTPDSSNKQMPTIKRAMNMVYKKMSNK